MIRHKIYVFKVFGNRKYLRIELIRFMPDADGISFARADTVKTVIPERVGLCDKSASVAAGQINRSTRYASLA